jgi:hypothetical protein
MRKKMNAYSVLVEKPEERYHWENRRRRETNIKVNLMEIGWSDTDWIHLAQDEYQWRALVSTVMELPDFLKCL